MSAPDPTTGYDLSAFQRAWGSFVPELAVKDDASDAVARAIDRAERSRGEAADRPRVKFVTTDELARTAARGRRLSVRGRSARG